MRLSQIANEKKLFAIRWAYLNFFLAFFWREILLQHFSKAPAPHFWKIRRLYGNFIFYFILLYLELSTFLFQSPIYPFKSVVVITLRVQARKMRLTKSKIFLRTADHSVEKMFAAECWVFSILNQRITHWKLSVQRPESEIKLNISNAFVFGVWALFLSYFPEDT